MNRLRTRLSEFEVEMWHRVQSNEALNAGVKKGDTRFLIFKKTSVTVEPQEPEDKERSVTMRCRRDSAV